MAVAVHQATSALLLSLCCFPSLLPLLCPSVCVLLWRATCQRWRHTCSTLWCHWYHFISFCISFFFIPFSFFLHLSVTLTLYICSKCYFLLLSSLLSLNLVLLSIFLLLCFSLHSCFSCHFCPFPTSYHLSFPFVFLFLYYHSGLCLFPTFPPSCLLYFLSLTLIFHHPFFSLLFLFPLSILSLYFSLCLFPLFTIFHRPPLFPSLCLCLYLSFSSSLCIYPNVCLPVTSCGSRFCSLSVLELIHLESALKHAPPLLSSPLFVSFSHPLLLPICCFISLSLLNVTCWISFFDIFPSTLQLYFSSSVILSVLCSVLCFDVTPAGSGQQCLFIIILFFKIIWLNSLCLSLSLLVPSVWCSSWTGSSRGCRRLWTAQKTGRSPDRTWTAWGCTWTHTWWEHTHTLLFFYTCEDPH